MRDLSALPDLKLALVQTSMVWQDVQANHTHFASLLDRVQDADLVILPEMFTTGFSMDAATLAEAEDGPSRHWMQDQAKRLSAVVVGSLIIRTGDGSYRNRLYWVRPDGSFTYYDKRHLFRMAGEHKHYAAGERRVLLDVKGWHVRPLVCYDLRFPVWSRDPYDTDLLIYVACWPAARRNAWNRLLPARAIENLCYVAAVNRIGSDGNEYPYSGDSQVLDFHGDPLVAPGDADGVFHVTLKGADLAAFRQRFPAYQDADAFELKF
ncbi:amidohydrolase [Azomonas macrocytogenes]|uniref:Omega-amidase YafV n=1 Tax=Azomonas macrocytogenes TaxID=69962 RepID=A0A839SXP4_AZOMA|nr:amidohydrolase [Azomonas macrocytogenes]MBB3101882.1 putative amidohydrolase [Azomonas macrocytogenes]